MVEEWTTTTEAHVVEGLKTGEEYTIRETVAPEGYTLATDVTFTIDETGKVTSTGTVTEDGVMLIEDEKTTVSISKVDVADGAELEGATLQILDSEGKVVDEWTTTTEAHVVESRRPARSSPVPDTDALQIYTLATDVTFTIDETGKVTATGTDPKSVV